MHLRPQLNCQLCWSVPHFPHFTCASGVDLLDRTQLQLGVGREDFLRPTLSALEASGVVLFWRRKHDNVAPSSPIFKEYPFTCWSNFRSPHCRVTALCSAVVDNGSINWWMGLRVVCHSEWQWRASTRELESTSWRTITLIVGLSYYSIGNAPASLLHADQTKKWACTSRKK